MLIYYPLAICLAVYIFYYSQQADTFYQAAVSKLDFATQSEVAWKSLLESLSLNLYQGATKIQDEITILGNEAQSSMEISAYLSVLFVLITLLYFFYLYKSKSNNIVISKNLVYIAFICFVLGVSTTMLNLIAFRDLPMLGKVVLKYEAKTVSGVIQTLWLNQKYLVFLCLSVFSIIVPLLKLTSLLYVMATNNTRIRSQILAFSDIIGKWSMTDVFVVAVLLAVFSLNADATTDAWLGQGLYFFTAYAVLSMIAGQRVSLLYRS